MKKILIVLLVLVFLITGSAVFLGFRVKNSGTIHKNVYVGETLLEELTVEQAQRVLESGEWAARCSVPLTVTLPGGIQFTVDPVESGLCLSAVEAAQAAYAYGHDSSLFGNLRIVASLLFAPVDVNAQKGSADIGYLERCMDEGETALKLYMGEEEYSIDKEAALMTMVKGWPALALEREALLSDIMEALKAGETELTFTGIKTTPVMPDYSALLKELEREPMDAKYSDDGRFEVIDEVVGLKFNVSEAQALWEKAVPGEKIQIPLDVQWPAVTGEYLRGQLFRDLLGAATTKFPNSGPPRRNNLGLATSKISEMILYPGEQFSYNEVVGVRTEEAGFLPAPAYVDGDVKDEIGGGACQVSSTLYAATVFAFLETVERECHYFPVNYMQMGTDATVTIPEQGGRSIDFKFKNNKNYPIKLVGIFNNEESTLTFEIWGTLEENDVMPLVFDNSYTWQYDYRREIPAAYLDRPGYIIKLTHEKWSFSDDAGAGSRTLTHRLVIDEQGTVISDEIINKLRENGQHAMDTYYQH